MTLAQRLDELAQANSQGLLSDDEYRLLRHSAFERYSQSIVLPAEKPIVPTAPVAASVPQPTPLQIKLSLIRRATASPDESSPPKRRLLPRLFHRKPADLPPLRITPIRSPEGSATPLSPTLSVPKTPRKSSASPHSPTLDDRSLSSSKDIREAVVSLELELLGLVDAFNNLERNAARQIKKRNARRLPLTTPTSVDVLLQGREWREHRMVPSPSTPIFDTRTTRHFLPLDDGLSVCSESSDRTSPLPPSSPLAHFRNISSSLRRKSSVSSVSSHSTSFFSPSRSAVSPQLPFKTPIMAHTDDDNESLDLQGIEDDDDQLSELHEIQHRRNQVITRYTQRIEYLKAKQKGAELHEKLLRK